MGSAYESVVFPESVVHCPRRAGAEFVSVSSGFNSSTPEPVRLSFKAYDGKKITDGRFFCNEVPFSTCVKFVFLENLIFLSRKNL